MSLSKVGNFFEVFNGNARTLYQVIAVDQHCTFCGGNDAIKMKIVSNNDEGLNNTENTYTLPDNKVGVIVSQHEPSLWLDIKNSNNMFISYPESKNAILEKRILDFNSYE